MRIGSSTLIAAGLRTGLAASFALAQDPYPGGSVDCHAQDADADGRIGPLLEGLDHVNVDDSVATIPTDCVECHRDEGSYSGLSGLSHVTHCAGGPIMCSLRATKPVAFTATR